MLLRFAVSNCRSIYEQQELSLVASKLKGPTDHLFDVPNLPDIKALPVAMIYGANASGKTSLVKAFSFMRSAILFSHSRRPPKGGVPRRPFALAPDATERPTAVEADFLANGIRYQYGFEANDKTFLQEWLYSYPDGKRRKLFERAGDKVEFGPSFRGHKKIFVDLMRENSLFLSTATQNSHPELSSIYRYFGRMNYVGPSLPSITSINNAFKIEEPDQRSINFLNQLGTGITGFRKSESEIPDFVRLITKEFAGIAKKHLPDQSGLSDEGDEQIEEKSVTIELSHKCTDGSVKYFNLDQESSGTRRLIVMMNRIFNSLDNGTPILIDELDASLHTHAALEIVKLFSNKNTNPHNSQLIATTHDTNLLGAPFLRRDQIWFVEKNEIGASIVFPLSDIRSRQEDDFERGYLEGRYGATPPTLSSNNS